LGEVRPTATSISTRWHRAVRAAAQGGKRGKTGGGAVFN